VPEIVRNPFPVRREREGAELLDARELGFGKRRFRRRALHTCLARRLLGGE
jgi:hypothetical protein